MLASAEIGCSRPGSMSSDVRPPPQAHSSPIRAQRSSRTTMFPGIGSSYQTRFPPRRHTSIGAWCYRDRMVSRIRTVVVAVVMTLATVAAYGCGGSSDGANKPPPTNPQDAPAAGYPDGHAVVPAAGQAEDVSSPTTVVGTGSPDSCTGDAFVSAVAKGGIVTFNCGPDPMTLTRRSYVEGRRCSARAARSSAEAAPDTAAARGRAATDVLRVAHRKLLSPRPRNASDLPPPGLGIGPLLARYGSVTKRLRSASALIQAEWVAPPS